MLATLVDKPFDAPGWFYEVKWDGYRALAFINNGKVQLKSRNDKSFNKKFYPIIPELVKWNVNAVVDGEVVVLKENGLSDFSDLQNWRSEADGALYYYVFDVCWYEGKDLSGLSLNDRRAILKSIVPAEGLIRYSDDFRGSGIKFFEAAKQMGVEGIIAKKEDSIYKSGIRSRDWLKIKANQSQEAVIAGYTVNKQSSRLISSLLLGVYENGKLKYIGRVGTGFSASKQKELLKLFKPLIVKKSPFVFTPDVNFPSRFRPDPPKTKVFYLKPKLVAQVNFTERTREGILRHPSFAGLREDKPAGEVQQDIIAPIAKNVMTTKKQSPKTIVRPAGKSVRKTLLNPADETQVRKVNGNELKFTNLSKLYWPREKISKRDMVNYYYKVAPYILPYLKNRPQSMNRHPDGITGKSFFYKDVSGRAPDWIKTYPYKSSTDNRLRKYLVATDEASLLYMASLGCIEMNPWHSRVGSEDSPDWCVIDLDPGKKSFEDVITTALVTHDVLQSLKIPSYPKTSGSKGIHIYIPLGAKYDYELSKEFARGIVKMVHQELPDITSIERMVKKRNGKLYLDFLQNRPQATISAPYSLRPKPGAPVSMPLHWSEVKSGLKITDFNIFNALERLSSEGDLFKPVLGKGTDVKKVLKQLNNL